ncbi:DUF3784 domain-containing protein [Clostridium sp.]|uniref:DUF3784 domain-containing protein n=1 Tax=Clostridium sp. TaxID=1506 RepID=UPI003D6CC567
MKSMDIYGLLIITLIMGGMFTFLGWVIKSQNAGDMLNGFDAKKYDKDIASRIVGGDMLYTGLLVILIGVVGVFFSSKFYNYITIVQVVIYVIGIIKMMYDMEKKCRIKK